MNAEMKQLINVFSEVFKAIHQLSYQDLAAKKLYPGQPQLLNLINAIEGITQKELSKRNCVKPSTITGMLNKLEANGYVYRTADEADKRIMRVYLTPLGQKHAEEGKKFLASLTEKLFQGFSKEELQVYLRLTEKIRSNIYRDKK
ncbi:MAG: MarR family transcriptional regulator [Mobilitalea sp.]